MTTIVKNDMDEARVTETAEHVRKKLSAYLNTLDREANRNLLADCPAYKNGLTMEETEVAIIRALGLMVLDGTQRMFRFQSEVEEYID